MNEIKTHFIDVEWISGGFHISLGYSGLAVIVILIVVYTMIKRSFRRGT